MVQAFDALDGDGNPTNRNETAHASMLGEVMDFVSEHKALSTIAGIGMTAGAIYLARAPIGKLLNRCGSSLFAAGDEAARTAGRLGEMPIGRQLATAADEVAVTGIRLENGVIGGAKVQPSILRAAGDDAIISGTQAETAAVQATQPNGKPLLEALDDAVKTGKAKTAPEPWVYNADSRALPRSGAGEIKPAAEPVEKLGTVGSTTTPEVTEIQKLGFLSRRLPAIDVNKHRFLKKS